ncbi:AbrB family transcriptional regulator [Microvirga guangxiensis]|uniref:Ammonia monooxygenase n=1 Tax=Microvirga guangxiensis TaxID=549386 RepID=A0A1G5F2J0_9HYPH|nr:AbrB family transcriptional regulator [Microvirga guangxiensis]SCY33459.1 hypothetical protein SAMN02927923_01195 [Microvirga guangxiensis]
MTEVRGILQRWLRAFTSSFFLYGRFVIALLIGAFGGWVFVQAQLPLPWMLGSMTACTLASLARLPIKAPEMIRPPMTMIIGVMLGAGFTPQILEGLGGWILTILGLAGFVLVSGAACVAYFRRIGGFDLATAYFSGMPGGIVEMVAAGDEEGGDARTIALVHSARILLVVLTLPFLVQAISGTAIGARPQLGLSILETSWRDEVWLLVTALSGAWIGRALRLPAHVLLGPMLVSAGVHIFGWTQFKPAIEIVNAAQLVLGTAIGCRFAGTATREVVRILVLSLGSTILLLAITAIFAVGVSRVSAYGEIPLLLAYSPGGLAEMSLVALALGIEGAFVAAHHIIRVFLVMLGAAPAFAIVSKRNKR